MTQDEAESQKEQANGGLGDIQADLDWFFGFMPAILRLSFRWCGLSKVFMIDLDPEPPCEVLPQIVGLGAAQPAFNRVEGIADKEISIEGGSGDKIMGVEEDASTTPVPERVMDMLGPSLWDVWNSLEVFEVLH